MKANESTRSGYRVEMRMFVALIPPERVLEDLGEFLEPRQEAQPGFRWTAPDQWHVTLAFMAQVEDRCLDDLFARLARGAARRTPFTVGVAGGGAFPNPARAKVLYAGLDVGNAEELRRLATGARAAASKAGAETDGGRFHPHLTLARTGRPLDVTRWIRVLDAYRGPTWTAREITLVESHLGEGPRRRPRYEVVESFPLGRTPRPASEPEPLEP
ncbi:MAG: RNA 2',3'-cyclic phosphodiesterase [Nocardioidaceae bacterium]